MAGWSKNRVRWDKALDWAQATPARRFRVNWLRRTWVAARLSLLFRCALVTTVLTVPVGALGITYSWTWVTVTSVISLVVSLVLLAWDRHERVTAANDLVQERRSKEVPLPDVYEAPYDTWSRLACGDTAVVHDPALDAHLAEDGTFPIDVSTRLWRPGAEPAKDYARTWPLRDYFWNQRKLRLASELTCEATSVRLQQTDYASYIVTNNLAKKVVSRSGVGELRLEDCITRSVTGEVLGFEDSGASNHLGGDVLAIAPGWIYLVVHDEGNEVAAGKWAPSGSGSFDFRDAFGLSDLLSLVKTGLHRELYEEQGLGRRSGLQLTTDDLRIIGFSRATYMGGKPQFYGVARLSEPIDPRLVGSERTFTKYFKPTDFNKAHQLRGAIERLRGLRTDKSAAISDSLMIITEMLALWHERDPDGTNAWLFGTD